ncbi:MAG: ribosome silencing factor [Balneolaceae bacterium]|nr:MAG: ribosome silencing factor [Balneolaceae bacterium]
MNETQTSTSRTTRKKRPGFAPLVSLINEALLEKKAENVRVLDVRKLTTLTDYFIVCQGGSDTQIRALANNVTEKIKEQTGEHVWRKEGLDNKKWVVLDYVDVVVHIFNEETRNFYALEKMWNDAEITDIRDEKS